MSLTAANSQVLPTHSQGSPNLDMYTVPILAAVFSALMPGRSSRALADSKLTDDQRVQCDPKSMTVKLSFGTEFNGIVFADGYATRQECRVFGRGTNTASINLAINTDPDSSTYCGLKKLSNKPSAYAVRLIVNQGQKILVYGLQKFDVTCDYKLRDITLRLSPQINGQVDPLVEGAVVGTGAIKVDFDRAGYLLDRDSTLKGIGYHDAPSLTMVVKEGRGIQGLTTTRASLGQQLTLDITTPVKAEHDYNVYNCYAHDNLTKPQWSLKLIDENGCAVTTSQVTDGKVSVEFDKENKKHIWIPLKGFLFASSDLVFFECQIKLCHDKCAPQCFVPPILDDDLIGSGEGELILQEEPGKSGPSAMQLYTRLSVDIPQQPTDPLAFGHARALKEKIFCLSHVAIICGVIVLLIIFFVLILCTVNCCKPRQFKHNNKSISGDHFIKYNRPTFVM